MLELRSQRVPGLVSKLKRLTDESWFNKAAGGPPSRRTQVLKLLDILPHEIDVMGDLLSELPFDLTIEI